MGLKAIKYQAESYLFKVYNGFNAPPRLDHISYRTKTESANNFYAPIYIGNPTIRKGRYFMTRELDSNYLKRIKEDGHLFALHDLNIESVDIHSFFSINYFSRITKYAWWTFNEDFQQELEIAVRDIPPHLLAEFIGKLAKYQTPYQVKDAESENALEPEPVKFARIKKLHCFKNHHEYAEIALKDEENRAVILKCLRKRQKEINRSEKNSVKTPKGSDNYMKFSDLFVNEEWRKKFYYVLSLLKPNYEASENGLRLIDAMCIKGKVPPNSHFQLFFITNMFMAYGAFESSDQDLSQICRKLYQSLRIDLDTTKFSYHMTIVLNQKKHIGGKVSLKKELNTILNNCNLL